MKRTKQWRRAIPILALAFLSFVTAGCGTSLFTGKSQQAPKTWTNPPFTDLRSQEKVTPDPTFDATVVQSNVYKQVKVLDSAGKLVTLNAAEQPLLFAAYWCPHCQRTLVLLNQNRSKLKEFPVIVSMGFAPGTKLSDAVKLSNQELKTFHISNVKEYYLLNPNEAKQVVQSFPTLAFPYQSKVEKLAGEHTLQVWEQAMNQK